MIRTKITQVLRKHSTVSMNGDFFRPKGIFAVAVGAGVVIGAAGAFLYQQIHREKRRLILQQEVNNLGLSVSELKGELEHLKALQRRSRRAIKQSTPSLATTAEADEVFSNIDSELEDEFFDLSDNDEPTLTLAEAKKEHYGTTYDELDALLEGNGLDKTKALGILLDLVEKDEKNPEILWRLSKANYVVGQVMEAEGNPKLKKEYVERGLEQATKCLQVAPRSSDAHKWYAICIGARGQYSGPKEKIRDGIEFRLHVEKALELSPDDATLHHLLGRFKFEVATLSWVERKVAAALFGEIPEATYEEASESLVKAEELSKEPWKENRLILAKCYLFMGDMKKGVLYLDKANEVPVSSPEDRVADLEIKALLERPEEGMVYPETSPEN